MLAGSTSLPIYTHCFRNILFVAKTQTESKQSVTELLTVCTGIVICCFPRNHQRIFFLTLFILKPGAC